MTTLITLTAPSLGTGYCPSGTNFWQTFANDLIGKTTATFNSSIGNSFFHIGDSTPGADETTYPWFYWSNSAGNLIKVGWYKYENGYWRRPHPITASSSVRQLWVGTPAALQTYDGGDTDPVTETSGPFWEEDTNFAGRALMAPGTIPDLTKVLAVGENYGEGQHTMTLDELVEHSHSMTALDNLDVDSGSRTLAGSGTEFVNDMSTDNKGETEPFDLIPPVRGIYVIKRTARLYYVITP